MSRIDQAINDFKGYLLELSAGCPEERAAQIRRDATTTVALIGSLTIPRLDRLVSRVLTETSSSIEF